MQIRQATVLDFGRGLLACLNNLSETSFPKGGNRIVKFMQQRAKLGVKTMVAVHRGLVVGTYSVFVEPKFIHGGSYVAHIEDVCVHPDWEGKGVGKTMMCHALAAAEKKKCYKAVLYCSQSLIPYYKKFGFYHNGSGMRLDFSPTESRD